MIDGNVNFDVVHDGLKEMKIVYPVNREKSKNYIRERKKKKNHFFPWFSNVSFKKWHVTKVIDVPMFDMSINLLMCQTLTHQ
jgi:hypothetical protein